MAKQPSAILCSDIHLQFKQPVAWTSDYRKGQEETWKFICDLQKELSVNDAIPLAVLMGGDIFDTHGGALSKWVPPELISWAINHLPENIIAIPGQHDLPQHNMELYPRSALAALEAAGKVEVLLPGRDETEISLGWGRNVLIKGFGWDVDPVPFESSKDYERTIAMIHVMTYLPKQLPYPGCKADNTRKLMGKLEGFDLILTGDNHTPFIVDDGDQVLVNPGCIMRRTAAHIDYEPCVYLWYAEDNTVEAVKLPKIGELTRDHVEAENVKNERLEAFVEHLASTEDLTIEFEPNLERFMAENDTSKAVQNRVWEIVDTRRMV